MTHGRIGRTKRHGSTLEGMWMYGSRNEYYGYGYGTYGEKYRVVFLLVPPLFG